MENQYFHEHWQQKGTYRPRPLGPFLKAWDFRDNNHTPDWSWAAAICEHSLQLEALIADYDLATDRWDPMWPNGYCAGGSGIWRWSMGREYPSEFQAHPLRRAAWREYFEARGT